MYLLMGQPHSEWWFVWYLSFFLYNINIINIIINTIILIKYYNINIFFYNKYNLFLFNWYFGVIVINCVFCVCCLLYHFMQYCLFLVYCLFRVPGVCCFLLCLRVPKEHFPFNQHISSSVDTTNINHPNKSFCVDWKWCPWDRSVIQDIR